MAITKQSIAQIHAELDAALKAIAAKHGLDMSKSRIVYTDTKFKMNLEFHTKEAIAATAAEAGLDADAVEPADLEKFKAHGWKFGLKTEHLGKICMIQGKQYRLLGMSGYSKLVVQRVFDGVRQVCRAEDFAQKFIDA